MTDWIQTYTAKQFFPLEPRIEDVDIHDIAHALSLLCRYGGHCEEFYSVAQHCVLVSYAVPESFALEGLMHDAAEAYLIDIPRPIKHSGLIEGYRAAEDKLELTIWMRYGLRVDLLPLDQSGVIKMADRHVMRTEQRDLMKPPPVEWKDDRAGALPDRIETWPWRTAERKFLDRFNELMKARMHANG
jgi:hypothetical protein